MKFIIILAWFTGVPLMLAPPVSKRSNFHRMFNVNSQERSNPWKGLPKRQIDANKEHVLPYMNIISGKSKEWTNCERSNPMKRANQNVAETLFNKDPLLSNDCLGTNIGNNSKFPCPINLLYGNNLTVKNFFLMMPERNYTCMDQQLIEKTLDIEKHISQQPNGEHVGRYGGLENVNTTRNLIHSTNNIYTTPESTLKAVSSFNRSRTTTGTLTGSESVTNNNYDYVSSYGPTTVKEVDIASINIGLETESVLIGLEFITRNNSKYRPTPQSSSHNLSSMNDSLSESTHEGSSRLGTSSKAIDILRNSMPITEVPIENVTYSLDLLKIVSSATETNFNLPTTANEIQENGLSRVKLVTSSTTANQDNSLSLAQIVTPSTNETQENSLSLAQIVTPSTNETQENGLSRVQLVTSSTTANQGNSLSLTQIMTPSSGGNQGNDLSISQIITSSATEKQSNGLSIDQILTASSTENQGNVLSQASVVTASETGNQFNGTSQAHVLIPSITEKQSNDLSIDQILTASSTENQGNVLSQAPVVTASETGNQLNGISQAHVLIPSSTEKQSNDLSIDQILTASSTENQGNVLSQAPVVTASETGNQLNGVSQAHVVTSLTTENEASGLSLSKIVTSPTKENPDNGLSQDQAVTGSVSEPLNAATNSIYTDSIGNSLSISDLSIESASTPPWDLFHVITSRTEGYANISLSNTANQGSGGFSLAQVLPVSSSEPVHVTTQKTQTNPTLGDEILRTIDKYCETLIFNLSNDNGIYNANPVDIPQQLYLIG